MKVSLNWAQQFSNVDLKAIGRDKLLEKIGEQIGAIDEVDDLGPRYQGIVVVKVLESKKHDNADKLSVCIIDDGGKTQNVERNSSGHVQVVCGAPNVHADMLAAWIPPGATVPSTLGKDPLTIEARDIRGQSSNGMLASLHELGLSDDHGGILEIVADEVGPELSLPGADFKQLYKLDDTVVDIENKMFTHRPDCFGILGVARELAGIQQLGFKSPDWYINTPQFESRNDLPLEVSVEDQALVPRFMAVAIKDVKVGSSPVWLQSYLSRVGVRVINNIVDLTNYYMYLTGQPLHAYDYDKLKSHSNGEPKLIARQARDKEKLNLLGGKTMEFDAPTIMIATDKVAVGAGGVMGGADTEVDENTTNIVLECASFDMYNIRRTSMRYGLFTDAVTRFNKGQSVLQNDRVIAKAIEDIIRIAGGSQASDIKDVHGDLPQLNQVRVNKDFVNARLGSKYSADEMANLLRNVEFLVDANGDDLDITAPFWRTDIEIPEDIVEEVGRLFGYDQLAQDLPRRSVAPSKVDDLIATKTVLRYALSSAGANEVLSYTFVHGDLLTKSGQNKDHAFELANALSPDLQYYRLSLIPSLLDKVRANIRQGYNEFALFEINPVHAKDFVDKDNLPIEDQRLALVFAADNKTAEHKYTGAPYYQAKQYLVELLAELGVTSLEFEPAINREPNHTISQAAIAPFEKQRSAIIKTKDGQFIGEVGEFKSSVRKNLKLPDFVAGFELDVGQLNKLRAHTKTYTPIPRFPKVEQDITLKVSTNVLFADLQDFMEEQLETPAKSAFWLTPLGIYRESQEATSQNISFRLSIASYERTLTTDEVNGLLDKVAAAAKDKFGADRA